MPHPAGTKNMTSGDYRRVIIDFALPLMLSLLFQQLYNAADSLIVGRFLGKEALAGVSSSGTLILLLVNFFPALHWVRASWWPAISVQGTMIRSPARYIQTSPSGLSPARH